MIESLFTVFREKISKTFLSEIIPTSSFKIGGILGEKNENPLGARCRCRGTWNPAKAAREPREKPLANPDKPLANECGRRVLPNYDAPTLTTAGEARGNERGKNVLRFFFQIYRNEV